MLTLSSSSPPLLPHPSSLSLLPVSLSLLPVSFYIPLLHPIHLSYLIFLFSFVLFFSVSCIPMAIFFTLVPLFSLKFLFSFFTPSSLFSHVSRRLFSLSTQLGQPCRERNRNVVGDYCRTPCHLRTGPGNTTPTYDVGRRHSQLMISECRRREVNSGCRLSVGERNSSDSVGVSRVRSREGGRSGCDLKRTLS